MSFNFEKFLAGCAAALPMVGAVVKELHPGNSAEALKIDAGTAIFTALVQGIQQASATSTTAASTATGLDSPHALGNDQPAA